jgi:hypothetical protein
MTKTLYVDTAEQAFEVLRAERSSRPARQCGDCQLCCKLLPVPPLGKPGGTSCRFQKFHKGCTVYRRSEMPPECAIWNCRWLVNDDADELSRPDRSHYVIDVMPDFITIRNDGTGALQHWQVVQIWVDPKCPTAHRDPALRRWLSRRAEQGILGLVRFSETDALVLFPPQIAPDGQWHEIPSGQKEKTHTLDEMIQALGGQARMVVTP